jgi:chemotaxis protein MotA
MELSAVIGFAAGFVFIVVSVLLGTGFDVWLTLKSFFDPASVLIVFGGCAAGTLIAHPAGDILNAFRAARKVFRPESRDAGAAAAELTRIARLARRGQILRLEEAAQAVDDGFVRGGLLMVADGAGAGEIRAAMETAIARTDERHRKVRAVWEYIAGAAPAWGMIGTLIGLVLMLNDLTNTAALGPKMATALITTFYGAVISHFAAGPIAGRLELLNETETGLMRVIAEAVADVRDGRPPRDVEERFRDAVKEKAAV